MAQYYYFISTLPMLSMGKKPSLSYTEFMKKAKELVNKKDYESLEKAVFTTSTSPSSSPLVRSWQEYRDKINTLIAKERAGKLSFPGYEKGADDFLLTSRIKDIVAMEDPLKAEYAVISLYFDFLSREEGLSPFSSRALIIYALKLQLLERVSRFEKEEGKAEFDNIYKSIEEDIFR